MMAAGGGVDARYRFIRKLGEGATGEVYLVEHQVLGRREALKVLSPALADDPRFVERFRREARATHRAQHPNIVTVYDFGRLDDGRLFISMEHVDGRSLADVLRDEGPLPLERLLHVLDQLCGAVAHAHAHGVLHRDLKPANIALTTHRGHTDVVKVLDFGMAKILQSVDGLDVSNDGTVIGTPEFMAPEQFFGSGVDETADLYALGCVAYVMATGEPPFAVRRPQLVDAHLNRAPDAPSRRRPDLGLPRELDELVLRCLRKRPNERWPSARALQDALRTLPGGERGRAAAAPTLRAMAPVGEGGELALSPTMEALEAKIDDPEQLQAAERAVLLRLAEQLIDLGQHDADLICDVAEIRENDDLAARIAARTADLERRAEEIEQEARRREASLRGALGELSLNPSPLLDGDDESTLELAPRVQRINKRIADIGRWQQESLEAITQEGIALATERATVDERGAALYAHLSRLVDRDAERYMTDPTVRELRRRFEALRGRRAHLETRPGR
jgi:serine/threonine-protein kinase